MKGERVDKAEVTCSEGMFPEVIFSEVMSRQAEHPAKNERALTE